MNEFINVYVREWMNEWARIEEFLWALNASWRMKISISLLSPQSKKISLAAYNQRKAFDVFIEIYLLSVAPQWWIHRKLSCLLHDDNNVRMHYSWAIPFVPCNHSRGFFPAFVCWVSSNSPCWECNALSCVCVLISSSREQIV